MVAAGAAWADSHDAAECISVEDATRKLFEDGGWVDDHGFRFTNLCDVRVVVSYCDPHAAEARWACGGNHLVTGDHGETQPYYTVDRSIEPGESISTYRLEDHEAGELHWAACYAVHSIRSDADGNYWCKTGAAPQATAARDAGGLAGQAPSWGQSPEHADEDGCWQPPEGCVATTAHLEGERLVARVTNNCAGDVYVRFCSETPEELGDYCGEGYIRAGEWNGWTVDVERKPTGRTEWKLVGLNAHENDLVCAGKVEGWDAPPDYD